MEKNALGTKEDWVQVEYGGYRGVARMRRIGYEVLRWQIAIFAQDGQEICYWDGPEIVGSGPVLVAIEDIENAQHEINQAIQNFLWDPMSQS